MVDPLLICFLLAAVMLVGFVFCFSRIQMLKGKQSELEKKFPPLRQEISKALNLTYEAGKTASHALAQVKAVINLDVGIHRDCGWLVLITKVRGQDRVMLQELKPEMTPEEYRDLIKRLKYDCGAVLRYADAPPGMAEAFLYKSRW